MTRPWQGEGDDPWLPARLDARLEVAKAERDIRTAFWAALSRWLAQTARRVLRGDSRPPDLDAVWARVPDWRDAVDLVVSGEVAKAMGVAYAALLGDGYAWDRRPFVTSYLAQVRDRLVRVPDEVYDLIAGQVSQGVNLGEGIPKLAARVDDVLSTSASERWPNRATTVARTEAIGALNAGRFDSFQILAQDEDGPMEKMWLCLLPNTPVVAAGVRWAARRGYEGETRTLWTAGGRRITVTAEHPVLTARGWVSANLLDPGDHLASVPGVQPIGTPDVKHGYATIEECFDTAAEVGEVTSLDRAVSGGMYFDGHGACEVVDVVPVDGNLTAGVQASVLQPLLDLGLEASDQALSSLVVGGSLAHGAVRNQLGGGNPALSPVPLDLDLTLAAGTQESGRALVPDHDTSDAQHPTHSVRTGVELAGESVDRLAALIELDELISIEVGTWSGHVYDFTTYCHWFLADGLIVHNSTDDRRTRPTHDLADGQRVPVASPFAVGGFPLMFPGDPSGPPQEIISCRCTMLLVERGESVDMSNRQMRGRGR